MKSKKCAVPVLVLAFNRPEHLRRLLSHLRKVKPTIIYCAQDGPRAHRPSDIAQCAQVKNVWNEIDWPCTKHFLIRNKNLGCQKGVSSAITWFFQHESQGIILEDDCIPHPSFFPYCSELLTTYADDTRIMHISGNSFCPTSEMSVFSRSHSYRFSKYTHCWGWATWRRAWKHYDHALQLWPTLRNVNWLHSLFPNPLSKLYWTRVLEGVYNRSIDSWAIPWMYSCWIDRGLSILPNKNLVSNQGFDELSTHTFDPHSPMANLKTETMKFPLKHPSHIMVDHQSDLLDQKHVYEQLSIKKIFGILLGSCAKTLHSVMTRITIQTK